MSEEIQRKGSSRERNHGHGEMNYGFKHFFRASGCHNFEMSLNEINKKIPSDNPNFTRGERFRQQFRITLERQEMQLRKNVEIIQTSSIRMEIAYDIRKRDGSSIYPDAIWLWWLDWLNCLKPRTLYRLWRLGSVAGRSEKGSSGSKDQLLWLDLNRPLWVKVLPRPPRTT